MKFKLKILRCIYYIVVALLLGYVLKGTLCTDCNNIVDKAEQDIEHDFDGVDKFIIKP